ncbi:MAG TPA: PLP-dependent aminotransferase family protein, partial [Xanthomonadaceae bacterium]|nr:PLP-dependent aminotransferase family protein [Xanthomonadaceae bacterium]
MEPVFPFDVTLPAQGEGEKSRELHRQLRAAILDGRMAAGAALPATREAAAALGIARNTVVAAYDLLVAEGYVLPHRGAKAVVADVAPRRARTRSRARPSTAIARLNPLWNDPPLRPDADRKLPARCFRLGVPEHRFFPHEAWRRLYAQALRAWSKQPFAYPPSEGLPELRAAIAQHVAFARAVACTADDVIVTSGAQQSVDLIARMLVTPGQTRVAVEDPGYPPVRASFAAAGAQLVPIPVDEEGLCVDQLPRDARIVSVTPSHQSPTGVALSLRRRMALLDFARTHGAIIVEDDYDGEFRFGGRPLDALQTLDADGRVFYVGTFSKSLFPALRKGFVVAPAWACANLVAIKHCCDSHCDSVAQATLATFIRDGHLARHVRRMRPIYAQRREVLLGGLRGGLGVWFEAIPSEAGLHLSARIRDPKLAARILAHVREHMPGAQSTAEYALSPPARPAVTFGYGVIDAKDMP